VRTVVILMEVKNIFHEFIKIIEKTADVSGIKYDFIIISSLIILSFTYE